MDEVVTTNRRHLLACDRAERPALDFKHADLSSANVRTDRRLGARSSPSLPSLTVM
jgi:hypothetical protein